MIDVDRSGPIWTVTLNRPEKANALTAEMLSDLADACAAATQARALVLTGVGKVFCAGADLDAARAGLATSPDWERLSSAIAGLPGLTIAALNGTLAGGAMARSAAQVGGILLLLSAAGMLIPGAGRPPASRASLSVWG